MAKAFAEADIPLWKLANESLRDFLKNYTKRNIPDESTLRKNYIPMIFDETIEKIRLKVATNDIFLMIDETTDSCKRNIANVLVGILNGEKSDSMLLMVKILERTNHSTILQTIMDSLTRLWPDGIKYDRFKLLVTDQARYMTKAGRGLKEIFPRLAHITCIAHALHLVCEEIRGSHPLANKYIGYVKAIFVKSPLRIEKYKEELKISLPPEPIIIRWGTWIKASLFHLVNFDAISKFILTLDDDSEAIKKAKELIKENDLQTELLDIYKYRSIVESILQLEEKHLEFQQQIDIINNAKSKLDGKYLKKLEDSLAKNPDFESITDKPIPVNMFYAPLVSIDVERSFSSYKNLLTDRRTNLLEANIESLLIIKCNSLK